VIDLYRPKDKAVVPILLFVHGGGWSAGSRKMGEGGQPAHFANEGYAWASAGYRLVPQVAVDDQAADLASAIAWLVKNARHYRLDPQRIVLIGHSSGAQLAALIATDPAYLKAAGVAFDAIKAVISLDGAGLDVPGIMAAGAAGSPFYKGAFGDNYTRQQRLSPQEHIGPPDAPHWLLVFDAGHNPSAGRFATAFAQGALRVGNVDARVLPIENTTHMRLLEELGKEGDKTTQAVDAFLKEVLGSVPSVP